MKNLMYLLIAIIFIIPVDIIVMPFEIIWGICDFILDLFDRYIVWMDKLMSKLLHKNEL